MKIGYEDMGDIMTSRMERYTSKENEQVSSRALKNQKMYDDLYTNTAYTSFSSIDPSVNVIDLSKVQDNMVSRREAYQKSKGATNFGSEDVREIRDYEYDYPKVDNITRDFDINHVLEEAKKNREDEDELERKRKLRTTEYNILTDLNDEKMKEYQKNKKDVLSKAEEKNLEELIHTITSKTMAHDVNEILERERQDRKNASKKEGSLLDDLMPTQFDETVITSDVIEQVQEYSEEDTPVQELTAETVIDKSFYTKSMDLSVSDLMRDDDGDDFVDDIKTPTWIKIVVSILVVCFIIGIAFVVYQYLLK